MTSACDGRADTHPTRTTSVWLTTSIREHDETRRRWTTLMPDESIDEADPAGLDFTSVFVLCARQPFEDWARESGGTGPDWTLPADRSLPGVPHAGAADDSRTRTAWLQQHYAELFERQLDVDRRRSAVAAGPLVRHLPRVVRGRVRADRRRHAGFRPSGAARDLRSALAAPGARRVPAAPADGSLHVDIATGELFAWTDDELDGDSRGRRRRASGSS